MLRFIALLPLVGLVFWIIGFFSYGLFNMNEWYVNSATGYTATAWYAWPWNWPGASIVHTVTTQLSGTDHIAEYSKAGWEHGGSLWVISWMVMVMHSCFAVMVNVGLAIAPASCAYGIGALIWRVAKTCRPGGMHFDNLMRVHKLSLNLLMPMGFIGLLGVTQGLDIPVYVSNAWRIVLFAVATGAVLPIAMISGNQEEKRDEA